MAYVTLIMGESGTGKSTSVMNLDPKQTFIINVLDKPLPFRGFRNNYKKHTVKENGNYFASDNAELIKKMIDDVNHKRPEIKYLIIDDYQYVMANEFMRRSKESGFSKFTDIGRNGWDIINKASTTRDDLYIFVMAHTENDGTGRFKCKTIGKMLDEKITLEGMFTVILHSIVSDSNYKFLTQNNGIHIAKSPMGMFNSTLIDNDLKEIASIMQQYFESEALPQSDTKQIEQEIKNKFDSAGLDIDINTIKSAKSMETLSQVFGEITKRHKKDKSAIEKLIAAKDERKQQLGEMVNA
jgi:hypothetical protein